MGRGNPQGSSKLLAITPKYGSTSLAATDTASVSIEYKISADAPDGYYNIVHILPAGLEFTRDDWRYGDKWWLSEVKGKQITFTVYKRKGVAQGTARFSARVTMPGAFASEGTFILHPTEPGLSRQVKGETVVFK